VRLAGGTPIIVQCPAEAGFKLTPDALAAAITPRTRWLFLNSPSNPSGAVYSEDHLRALADVLLRHPNVWVLTDDIYEHIIFDGRKQATIAAVEPRLKSRTLTVNGVSKSYAMTGFRIGFGGGPAELMAQMLKMQSQSTSGANSIGQAAAVAALRGPQDFIPERSQAFQDRRDLVVAMLNQATGLQCETPEGAFYLYPNCAGVIGKTTPQGKTIETDLDFVMHLMDDHGVATVQGAAYGMSPYFRVSIAVSMEDLERGCQRIQRAAAELT
jgi:aspartate aminotransferase